MMHRVLVVVGLFHAAHSEMANLQAIRQQLKDMPQPSSKSSSEHRSGGSQDGSQSGNYQQYMKQYAGGSQGGSEAGDYQQYMKKYAGGSQGDYQQYMKKYTGGNQGDADAATEKHQTDEDAMNLLETSGNSGTQSTGDYQQYMKKYAGGKTGDYQQYMKRYAGGSQGGSQTGDYQQYMKKYAGGSHGGGYEQYYSKYMHQYAGGDNTNLLETSGSSAGTQSTGDYQQYMKNYAGGYQKYADYQKYQKRYHSKGHSNVVSAAHDAQNVSQLEAWRSQSMQNLQWYVPAGYSTYAEKTVDRQYAERLRELQQGAKSTNEMLVSKPQTIAQSQDDTDFAEQSALNLDAVPANQMHLSDSTTSSDGPAGVKVEHRHEDKDKDEDEHEDEDKDEGRDEDKDEHKDEDEHEDEDEDEDKDEDKAAKAKFKNAHGGSHMFLGGFDTAYGSTPLMFGVLWGVAILLAVFCSRKRTNNVQIPFADQHYGLLA